MKAIKMKQQIINSTLFIGLLMMGIAGCKKIAGLRLQENTEHNTSILDAHINKTAWQYLKDRSVGSATDTIFKRMYEAIIYSGIDTSLYLQSDKTFIFLHNDAVFSTARATATDCYWGRYKVGGAIAKSWTQYTPQQVKNWLLYLIVNGNYTYETLGPENVVAKTILPEGADPANPQSIMYFVLGNDRDSRVQLNNFINSVRSTAGRTSGILSDNGPIHVVDRVVEYGVKP